MGKTAGDDFDAVVRLLPEDQLDQLVWGTVKKTYSIADGRLVVDAPEPLAHDIADEEADPRWPPGSDYWPFKGVADVAVLGNAYARDGRAVEQRSVSVRVGRYKKRVQVFGTRFVEWEQSGRPRLGRPEPFVELPLTYRNAYGGIDDSGHPQGAAEARGAPRHHGAERWLLSAESVRERLPRPRFAATERRAPQPRGSGSAAHTGQPDRRSEAMVPAALVVVRRLAVPGDVPARPLRRRGHASPGPRRRGARRGSSGLHARAVAGPHGQPIARPIAGPELLPGGVARDVVRGPGRGHAGRVRRNAPGAGDDHVRAPALPAARDRGGRRSPAGRGEAPSRGRRAARAEGVHHLGGDSPGDAARVLPWCPRPHPRHAVGRWDARPLSDTGADLRSAEAREGRGQERRAAAQAEAG